MSRVDTSKLKTGVFALALAGTTILLAAPAAEARVGIGFNLAVPPPIAAPPPVIVAPPAVAAPPVGYPPLVVPPPLAVAPMPYYAPPYYFAPAPSFGFFWSDRFGHRHWHR